jgi:hypothetical protein
LIDLIEKRDINIEKFIYELRSGIWTLKNGTMNWEEENYHWKVDWRIEKRNMKIEKLIYELKRAIWTLKSGLMNQEEEYKL